MNSTRATHFARISLLLAAALVAPRHGLAQDSGSKPPGGEQVDRSAAPGTDAASGPTAALRDALSAACSQSAQDFARTLTARNTESFSRLAPAARVALMKRFVLLNEPGKATIATDASGRPTVRCETPAITTQMQIGGADIRDNIAFLPLELQDAIGAELRRVTMGLVRENGEWKLLSLGLLLLDLPALEVEWDQAEIETNERSALESIKKLAEAIETYRKTYARLPESLAPLGPPLHGLASGQAAGLLDSDLATGSKNGYAFRYVIVGASALGAPAKFELSATPLRYERTGLHSFFRDASGALHAADRKGAVGSDADPKVE